MMVASIAFNRLNPRAKAKATALLAIPINPAGITAKSLDFINASHWADDLRPFAEFDFLKILHFIDQPFSTDGTPLPRDLPEPENIVEALTDNVKILRTNPDKNAQAQALRLIIHFVGDIHQPLHCATRVDSAHPDGDRGGNLVGIMVAESGGKGAPSKPRRSNLHSFWDGGMGTFPPTGPDFEPPPLSQIPAAAARVTKGNPPTAAGLKLDDPFDFKSWADESFQLAKDVAYKDVKNGAKIDVVYMNSSLKVAQQRVAWGGYRLAALLNAIWP